MKREMKYGELWKSTPLLGESDWRGRYANPRLMFMRGRYADPGLMSMRGRYAYVALMSMKGQICQLGTGARGADMPTGTDFYKPCVNFTRRCFLEWHIGPTRGIISP